MPTVRQAINKRCLGWVLGLCGLFVALPTRAEEEARRLVVVAPEASTGLVTDELVTALRGQLAELGVQVVLSSRPVDAAAPESHSLVVGEQDALAFVWLGREGDVLAVHFFESAGAVLRQRRLPLRGTDAASLEEVALVVRSAMSALLERRAEEPEPAYPVEEEEVAPRDSSRDAPVSAPVAPAVAGRAPLWAAVGWLGESYAPQLPFTHGARIALGVRPKRSSFGIGLGYAVLPTQTAEGREASVTLSRHPLEAFFSLRSSSVESLLFVGMEAGVVADLLHRRTSVVSPEFLASPDETRVSWALSGRGLLGMQLGSNVSLQAQGGADLVLNRVKSSLEDGTELVTPHRLRPRLMVLVSWDFP